MSFYLAKKLSHLNLLQINGNKSVLLNSILNLLPYLQKQSKIMSSTNTNYKNDELIEKGKKAAAYKAIDENVDQVRLI